MIIEMLGGKICEDHAIKLAPKNPVEVETMEETSMIT